MTWVKHAIASLGLLAVSCGDDAGADSTDTSGSTGADGSATSAPSTDATTDTPTSATTMVPDTTGVDSSGTADTGPGSLCGDAFTADDEDCDDGNTENGDACYADCTLAYEEQWTISIDNGIADDIGREAVVDDAGNLYVAGVTDVAIGDGELWIQQILPDGTAGWSFTYSGVTGEEDQASAMTWIDGDLLVAGFVSVMGGQDALLLRVDPSDQSVVWETILDAPGMAEDGDRFRDLAVAPDGSIVAVGSASIDGQQTDAWIVGFDSAGTFVWDQTRDGAASQGDTAITVAVTADGTVHAMGWEESMLGNLTGWRTTYAADGTPGDDEILGYIAVDLAVDPMTDTIVVVGQETPGATLEDCMVRAYDASYTEQWVTHVNGPGNSTDACVGVTLGPDGHVYAAGNISVVNEQENLWLGRISPSGELLWADTYNNDRLNIGEFGAYLVVDPDGNAFGVGLENQFGEGVNLFVRKYTQGPPPA